MNSTLTFNLDLSVYEKQQYEEIGKNVVAYFSILMVLGIIGNGHVLVVYRREGKEFNYKIFVMAHAINDFIACIIIFPNEIVLARYSFTYRNEEACKAFKFLSSTLALTSVFLFVLTGFERYRRICTPFKEQLTRKTVLIACCITSGVSCLLSIPVIIMHRIVGTTINEYPYLNGTKCEFATDTFSFAYFGLLLLIATIMFIILVLVYLKIAMVLFRHRHNALRIPAKEKQLRPKSKSVRFRNNKTATRNTISLMFVTLFSYIGSIPLYIFVLIKFTDENTYVIATQNLGEAALTIIRKGYFINNVVNPIVYIIVDKQFREGIRHTYLVMWNTLKCSYQN